MFRQLLSECGWCGVGNSYILCLMHVASGHPQYDSLVVVDGAHLTLQAEERQSYAPECASRKHPVNCKAPQEAGAKGSAYHKCI
jgi:hypothetical protein